jgi:hypothetical protein
MDPFLVVELWYTALAMAVMKSSSAPSSGVASCANITPCIEMRIMADIIRAAEHETICSFLPPGATVPIVEIGLAVRFGVEAAFALPVLVIFLDTLAVAVNLWLILG